MPILSLTLKNVGPLDEVVFECDPQVNVLIGPNNCGKTTALLALAEVVMAVPQLPSKLSQNHNSHSVCPEAYFDFDTMTAEIVPRASLVGPRRRRAIQTIEDLGLNSFHHLKKRTQWLVAAAKAVGGTPDSDPSWYPLISFFTSRDTGLSSITRKLLVEKGISLPTE